MSTATVTKPRGTEGSHIGEPQARPWLYVVLGVGLVLVVTPFVWMVLGSFKTEGELRANPPTWWPHNPTLDNYRELFTRLDFPQYFLNSVVVAVAVTLGNLVFCSMLGYALAKLDFRGRTWLFRAGAGHADGARDGHVRAAVRAGQQPRAGQHATSG